MAGLIERRRGGAGGRGKGSAMTRAGYVEFLPQSQAVMESEPAPLARFLILVVAAIFAIAIAWAAIGKVEQVATAPGVVRPAGKVKVVNHPDGGRVAEVYVRDNQRVAAGDPLVRLDEEVIREEIVKREKEYQALAAETARLEAEAIGGDPAFPAALAAERRNLVESQMMLFRSRRDSLFARRESAESVVAQRRRDVAALDARLNQMANSLRILVEQETAIAELADKGYFPRLRYLSVQRQTAELDGQIIETRQTRESAQSALAEAISRRESVDKEWRSEVLGQLSETRRERDRAGSALLQEQSQLRNLVIRSPADGYVKDLAVASAGQSIRPNEPLMSVVPFNKELLIETHVSNEDIGYISKGQKATVKIQTYDFIRFGYLEGVVEEIAPDATENQETRQLTFSVMVRTDKNYLGPALDERPVQPGMQAQVDLLIGERSVLSYLTDRLQKTSASAFRER